MSEPLGVEPATTARDKLGDVRATNVRWWTLVGLTGFAFVSYLERVNISVAAEVMIPAFGFSKIQMGQIFTSFLIGYAIFQIPGGWLGDRFGPRLTLTVSAVVWGVATIATALVPSVFGNTAVASFVALWIVRFVLGLGQATMFPVGNRVVRNWMPPAERGTGASIMFLGTASASAATGPLVSWVMLRLGWQRSFYVTAIPAFLIAITWYVLARDKPKDHAHVNDAEHALVEPDTSLASQATATPELPPEIPAKAMHTAELETAETPAPTLLSLLRQRNVFLLVLSYTSEGYVLFIFVFWIYIYLVEKRGFSMIRGGWVAALPWLTALVLVPIGGLACDWLSARKGRLAGARVVIIIGYGLSGILLFLAAYAQSVWLSVAALSLSIGFLMGAESAFWATATLLAGDKVGSLSGVMNTAGIIGGIASTSLMPVLVSRFGWLPGLGSGATMALFCVLLWVVIVEQPQDSGGMPDRAAQAAAYDPERSQESARRNAK